MKEALVQNASSKAQIAEAKMKEKLGRDQELNDFRVVLNTKEGRRLVWRLMGKCNVFATVWDPSAKIHYNAGRQDLGHFIMAEVIAADENLLFQMMKENQKGESNAT